VSNLQKTSPFYPFLPEKSPSFPGSRTPHVHKVDLNRPGSGVEAIEAIGLAPGSQNPSWDVIFWGG